jgi:hypothetical protein
MSAAWCQRFNGTGLAFTLILNDDRYTPNAGGTGDAPTLRRQKKCDVRFGDGHVQAVNVTFGNITTCQADL